MALKGEKKKEKKKRKVRNMTQGKKYYKNEKKEAFVRGMKEKK